MQPWWAEATFYKNSKTIFSQKKKKKKKKDIWFILVNRFMIQRVKQYLNLHILLCNAIKYLNALVNIFKYWYWYLYIFKY